MQDYLLVGFLSGGQQPFTIENVFRVRLDFMKNSIFPHLRHLLQFAKRETHIHDISKTYVSFPQLFAKRKSLSFIQQKSCRYVKNI
jgi:hypothetical protein